MRMEPVALLPRKLLMSRVELLRFIDFVALQSNGTVPVDSEKAMTRLPRNEMLVAAMTDRAGILNNRVYTNARINEIDILTCLQVNGTTAEEVTWGAT